MNAEPYACAYRMWYSVAPRDSEAEKQMTGQRVGYIRVSGADQNAGRQLDGVPIDVYFNDNCSGKDASRPQLQAVLRHVRAGDTLIVHSIDRLARSLSDLLSMIRDLTGRGVIVEFREENLTFSGDDSPIARFQLQMLGAFAEFERSMIRERQREGIAMARAAGRRLGRLPSLTHEECRLLRSQAARGDSIAFLSSRWGISRSSVYNILRRVENPE